MSNHEAKTPDAPARSAKLPDEIIETQKCRSDLLKWKLLLVAGLGAAGLGLMEKRSPAPLLLALIPFACLYADLLCTSLKLRQVVIGTYFATFRQDPYEGFVGRVRRVFDLEDWALYWSTMSFSGLVGIFGITLLLQTTHPAPPPNQTPAATNAFAPGAATPSVGQPTPNATRRDPLAPVADKLAVSGFVDFASRPFQGGILALAGFLGILVSRYAQLKYRARAGLLDTQVPLGQCVVHNSEIRNLLRPQYSLADLESIRQLLINRGTFGFTTLSNGLFPAAGLALPGDASGYQFTWVRDNIHVAHAHFATGNSTTAIRTISALMTYFQKHEHRFRTIIDGTAVPADPMKRPHVRFDGERLAELSQKWPHAQNDALGYFLWLYCKLARKRLIRCDKDALACLKLFPAYLQAIQYWKDQDSGHWEEARKVAASSIGAVMAGLRAMKRLLEDLPNWADTAVLDASLSPPKLIDDLLGQGAAALKSILPCESKEPELHFRRFDAALLFLIYPLEVEEVLEGYAETILDDVTTHLQGDHGIRRYVGDSYWCADYKEKMEPKLLTADFSENTKMRDKLLRPGEEAQWCIFDPIISVIYGRRCAKQMDQGDRRMALESLRLQAYYLNRALGQLTEKGEGEAELRCPEAYYLREGRYVPNDQTPLLWAQANLWLALHEMQRTIRIMEQGE